LRSGPAAVAVAVEALDQHRAQRRRQAAVTAAPRLGVGAVRRALGDRAAGRSERRGRLRQRAAGEEGGEQEGEGEELGAHADPTRHRRRS
jgi:hypothetical protein